MSRLDFFWLGAGGFLTLFGANEIIAYATHPVPRWMGGPLALVGEILAVLVGLAIMYGLGLREPLPPPDPAVGTNDEGASSIDLRRACGSVSQSTWPRSSTNSRQ